MILSKSSLTHVLMSDRPQSQYANSMELFARRSVLGYLGRDVSQRGSTRTLLIRRMTGTADMESGPDSDAPSARFTPRSHVPTKRGASHHNRVIDDAIGEALRAHYRALAEAPLPDRFLVLLAELEAKDAGHDR